MALVVHGYRYSVYVRIVRMVLAEKHLAYAHREVNPFAANVPADYLALHPFKRVPTLMHGDFALYETAAIARYLDEAFAGPALQPTTPQARARMAQIIAIIDSYGYWPMVRQVFSQRVFAPAQGNTPDETMIADGIAKSHHVLAALEALAGDGGPLVGGTGWSLADLYLAPMMAYFTAAPEGAAALAPYKTLAAWWSIMRVAPSLTATDPGLPGADGASD